MGPNTLWNWCSALSPKKVWIPPVSWELHSGREHLEINISLCIAKLISAHGGCLGIKNRWRTYEAAKSLGELPTELWSEDVRMGKPGWSHVQSPLSEYIGQWEGTWGSETSQYPKEEKITYDSVSIGERKRKRPNHISVIVFRRCCYGVVGPFRGSWNYFKE